MLIPAVLDLAADEARALGHGYVGTEHVLLALVDDRGHAGEVLRDLGVTRERMLATTCLRPRLEPAPESLSLMPRLKHALEHGRRIADGLGASRPDCDHVLAGLIAVPDSMAVEILRRLGVRTGDVRTALAERLAVEPERLGAPRRRRRLRLRISRPGSRRAASSRRPPD